MADHHHHHHHHHRSNRILIPPRTTAAAASTPRPSYPVFTYAPLTPASTPSKHRFSIYKPSAAAAGGASSFSFLLLLLFSLRSLYSLLPFLRSSPPSFSIFPFSFLVSLLSFILTFCFSLFASITRGDSFRRKSHRPILSLTSITKSQHKLLLAKSLLLAVVFLLRFQALMYCGTAAMILAELSGNVAARFMVEGMNRSFTDRNFAGSSKVRGFIALFSGLVLLSISWDRVECFPFSHVNITAKGLSVFPSGNCLRIWPMLLPFLSGFLGCYERVFSNWGDVRELGQKRVRLITLFYTTVVLFIPAAVSMLVFEADGDSISVSSLGWPLANTVVFGVLLSENYTDEKVSSSKHIHKEYFITFVCTLVLELFYYPELCLWGLLICGLLLWISVRELDPVDTNYPELGFESRESFSTSLMKPLKHILGERKSRKIALFLLINTAYMVVEFVAGFMSNSLGLISDACHMLFDCAALAIGLYASYISRLPANSQFNYGRGRFEVLSGYVNAVFLVLVGALITLESIERILDPQEISTSSLLAVSIGGLVVNIVGLIFFHEEHHHAHGGSGPCSHSHSHLHSHSNSNSNSHSHSHSNHHHHHHEHDDKHGNKHEEDHITVIHDSNGKSCSSDHQTIDHKSHTCNVEGHHHYHKEDKKHDHHHHIDHNMQGIFLHVLADTMGSVGVVISTLLIKYKGWLVADPASSIFISALIVSSVIPLLRNSAEILLQRVPRSSEHDLKEALNDVMGLKGILGIQNLHVWSFTNTDIVGTVHLHVSGDADKASVRKQVSDILRDAGIKDLVIQVECINCS
ncbi:cation efflux family protein [Striga asiatica]|uniref:Cation efflux family protein n=1 Tax=Striga asiatica TaxID=4170 RepID=A0A5A7P9U4_STRAF|nr:cation efflux family protein [Striga asiatica]